MVANYRNVIKAIDEKAVNKAMIDKSEREACENDKQDVQSNPHNPVSEDVEEINPSQNEIKEVSEKVEIMKVSSDAPAPIELSNSSSERRSSHSQGVESVDISKLKMKLKIVTQDLKSCEASKTLLERRLIKEKKKYEKWRREKEVEHNKTRNTLSLREREVKKLNGEINRLKSILDRVHSKVRTNKVVPKRRAPKKIEKQVKEEKDEEETVIIKASTKS